MPGPALQLDYLSSNTSLFWQTAELFLQKSKGDRLKRSLNLTWDLSFESQMKPHQTDGKQGLSLTAFQVFSFIKQ